MIQAKKKKLQILPSLITLIHQEQYSSKQIMNQAQNADVLSVTTSNQLKILGSSSQAPSMNMASTLEMRSKLDLETVRHKDIFSISPDNFSPLPHIHTFAIIVQGAPHPQVYIHFKQTFKFSISKSVCVCTFTLHFKLIYNF